MIAGQSLFTFVGLFASAYFFYLARKWPGFMSTWHEHERIFLQPPYANKIKHRVELKIQLYAFLTLALSIFDHYLYFLAAVERTENKIVFCDDDHKDFWKILFVQERQALFQILPYRSWMIPLLELYEVCKTFLWAYSEVFMIVTSWTLALRFQQFNNRLKSFKGQHLDGNLWNEIRNHYNVIANLTIHAEKILSPLYLVYCFCNSYFLCQKIFIQFEVGKARWER